MEIHTILPVERPQPADRNSKPSAVAGTTTNISACSWADSWLGQVRRIQARNALVSLIPEIKVGGLVDALSCGEVGVGHLGVMSGAIRLPLIGPEMSRDIRLCTISWVMAGSVGFEPLALGLSVPLSSCGRFSRGCYGRVCRPALGGHVPSAKGGLLARGSRGARVRLRGANIRRWALRSRL